jgi:hypothetical protein
MKIRVCITPGGIEALRKIETKYGFRPVRDEIAFPMSPLKTYECDIDSGFEFCKELKRQLDGKVRYVNIE